MCKGNQRGMPLKKYQMVIVHDRHESTYQPIVVIGIVKVLRNRANNFY